MKKENTRISFVFPKFLIFNFSFLIFLLLHTYCLFRAGIYTYTAVDAGLGINLCLVFNHRNGIAGALANAGLACGAFFFVNFRRHYKTLSNK